MYNPDFCYANESTSAEDNSNVFFILCHRFYSISACAVFLYSYSWYCKWKNRRWRHEVRYVFIGILGDERKKWVETWPREPHSESAFSPLSHILSLSLKNLSYNTRLLHSSINRQIHVFTCTVKRQPTQLLSVLSKYWFQAHACTHTKAHAQLAFKCKKYCENVKKEFFWKLKLRPLLYKVQLYTVCFLQIVYVMYVLELLQEIFTTVLLE